MDTAEPFGLLAHACSRAEFRPPDIPAADALAAAMRSWAAEEIAEYRAAVLDELANLGDQPPTGFLAAELAALLSFEAGA